MRRLPIAVVGVCAAALAACGAGDSETIVGPTTAATDGAPTSTPSSAASTGSVATTATSTAGTASTSALPRATATGSVAATAATTAVAVPTATPNAKPTGGAATTTVTPPGGVQMSTTPTTTTTTSEPPSGAGDDGFDSVQWGPDVPPIPGEYSAFAVANAGDLSCESVDDRASEGDGLWKLAARVCRVLRDSDEDWPDVESVPAPRSGGNLYEQCLDGEMSAMLERALAWHNEHPGESPIVRFPGSGTHSPCQRSVYGVTVTAAVPAFDDGCNKAESQQVGRALVTMSAPGLPDGSPRATVDDIPLCVIDGPQSNALQEFTVVVPTSGEAHAVTIHIETTYGRLSADVELPAVDVAVTEPSAVTTSTPTPTESASTTTDSTIPSTPAPIPAPTTPTPEPTSVPTAPPAPAPTIEPIQVPAEEPTPTPAAAGLEPQATDDA
jgi:hypothetical protein